MSTKSLRSLALIAVLSLLIVANLFVAEGEVGSLVTHGATALMIFGLVLDRFRCVRDADARERQLREVMEHSGEVIFRTDPQGRWRFLNTAWEEMTGRTVADSLGQPYLHLVVEEDRAEALREFGRLTGGEVEEVTHELRIRHGIGIRWVAARARTMRDAKGKLVGLCGTLRNITSQRQADLRANAAAEAAREQNEILSLAGAVAQIGHWRVAADSGCTLSEEAARLMQMSAGNYPLPFDPAEAFVPEDRETVRAVFEKGWRGQDFEVEARLALPSGEVRHIYIRGVPEADWDGGVAGLFGVVQDVTERRRAQDALARQEAHYRRLAENATDVVVQVDLQGVCQFVSPSVYDVTGFSPEEVVGQDLLDAIHPEDQAAVANANQALISEEETRVTTTYRSRHKDGRWIWLETVLRAERDGSGRPVALTGSSRDVGQRKELELRLITARDQAQKDASQLYKLATTDELTGLANRRHALARLDQEIERQRRTSEPLTVAIFDIDLFKRINDVHGHDAGDAVLRSVAKCANQAVRSVDLVGRIGGEEFMLLLPRCDIVSAEDVCQRVREEIGSQIIKLPNGKHCSATISVGLAQISDDETADKALKRADHALYQAKHAGRNCLRFAA